MIINSFDAYKGLISIVVPVYNAAAFLKETTPVCRRSVIQIGNFCWWMTAQKITVVMLF